MTEQLLLADCLSRLNRLGVAYYLTGSMASNYWGIPRTTHDLDFVICLERSGVEPLVAAFDGDYYVDSQSVEAALRPPYQFNLIDTRSALKVDFWIPKDSAFDQEMLRRRMQTDVEGVPAWIATAEDVILHKLVWNQISPSDRQLGDAAGVWAVQKGTLDVEYMKRWAAKLGVEQTFERIARGEIRPKAT